jgi:septum formation topological specificity factor MinE
MSVAHAPSCPVSLLSLPDPPKCTCALQYAAQFVGHAPNHADDCPRHCTCDFGRRLREFLTGPEPYTKTRLKIVATLENNVHMDAEKIHAMESEVISVLEKHGVQIHQEERGDINYVSILTFLENGQIPP